jgi:hypothetical protein
VNWPGSGSPYRHGCASIWTSGGESRPVPIASQTVTYATPAAFSDASLSQMIADLCAQHVKLTGVRKERNAAYLKDLSLEQSRRYKLAKA